MESIIGALGTQEVPRMRLGIAPDHDVRDGAKYVLSQLKKAQLPVVDEVLDRAARAVEIIFTDGIAKAMSLCNQKPRAEGEPTS
jgi:PTH1 family peptidyl-tRNA hydrolase